MFATLEFWTALFAIVWINLLLSGDNAVVIALAARSLPSTQQRQAILWGSVAAIAMRLLITAVAVEMLKLPLLKIVGGLLLLWVAIQLLVSEEHRATSRIKAAPSLGAAVRTIMFADLMMSLDNVIGVIAAAHDNPVLIIMGIAIGIPLIMFGSTMMLKVMDRFPLLITLGGALLGYVAGEMMAFDVTVRGWIAEHAHWLQNVTVGPLKISVAGTLGTVLVIAISRRWVARLRRPSAHVP